ncbi:MAG: hypothetical protein J7L82_00695 [Staphylothermus sp.]|nr:hypothetical protein [Staphylothermus sp.]
MKQKKNKQSVNQSAYRTKLYSMMQKEKRDIAKDKLKDKGVSVGDIGGYNVSKLKSAYRKEKAKEVIGKVSSNVNKGVQKALKTKMVSRRVLKKHDMSYSMPNKRVENIFEDENRFFKGAVQNGLL